MKGNDASQALLLLSIFALNVLDAALTLDGVRRGIMTEANPFMAQLTHEPSLFVAVKLGLTCSSLTVLWVLRNRRRRRCIRSLSIALLIVYMYVVAYQLAGWCCAMLQLC